MADLLVVTTSLPRHPDDYAARFVLDWADAMDGLGHSVRFVAPRGRHCPYPVTPFRGGSVLAGGAPERLEASPLRGGLSGLRTTASLARALRSAIAPEHTVVAHWLVPGGLVACRYARPLVYAHGGDVALLERLPAGRRLARHLDRRAHTLAFVSRGLRARFSALLGRAPRARLAVAPMGVPAPAVDPGFAGTVQALASGRPIIATVGRLVPIKGYDALPAALAGLDAVWVAAGDGPEAARLARLAARHGVELRLLGAVSPGQRDALLSVARAFVQPSRALGRRTEGAPVAVMEALAAGLPVVARADAPFVELLPRDPLLFDDADSLRRQLAIALRGDDGRHRRAGQRFRWATQARAHERLLHPPPRSM